MSAADINAAGNGDHLDVVIVGAGFAGLYAVHQLRKLGFSLRVFEAADDIGGTWYWNRYPGARVDVPSIDYMFSFDADWHHDWQWSEKYPTQPEILRYLHHVADKHDLHRDIAFSTRVVNAAWDDASSTWQVRTDGGDMVTCRFLVMATGCLSKPKHPDIAGVEKFTGDVYYTSSWPHEGVDFTGKRVAVIGTGSSGVQSIPIIAEQAAALTVFQRTPNFSIPAHNGDLPQDRLAHVLADEDAYRQSARLSLGGIPMERNRTPTFSVPDADRREVYQQIWDAGELIPILNVFGDVLSNRAANEELGEFVRGKIRTIVDDPATAATLCPTNHPIGGKRPCLDSGYYATFNKPHVRLVDLRTNPLIGIGVTGIDTADESFDVDAIVFATGFDALTGALTAVNPVGRDGLALRDKWLDGPLTYLGLMSVGFPNMFMITGPGSPSVLSNMVVSIEQHLDWVGACLAQMRSSGFEVIEPTQTAETGWMQHVADCGAITLHASTNSWYTGANVPGKPRVLLPYVAGVDFYRVACDKVAADEYLGFRLSGPGVEQCRDGVVRRLQPDVEMVLNELAELGAPAMETLSVGEARDSIEQGAQQMPPGPEVGEIVDGTLPGASGDLTYRLYRPATAGPHPILVYFHGGGWVLGSATSDDPLCRDLCVRTGAIIISVDYRHAPEHRFPAAIDDGFAATAWIAENAVALGGTPDRLAIGGWSAGGNIAAVVCQLARDAGGPEIAAQLLITPTTDADMSHASYRENAEGYQLSAPLVRWFYDHYVPELDAALREDPRLSPLRAHDLSGLPPAVVVTCEFDPLRDEGDAYAEALAAAGVNTSHLRCRGQIHTSLTMVDVVVSAEPERAAIAAALMARLPALQGV
jgi:cation diffusion facilitator CzcD-associated flavoprotein CzcO/acetyl esterase/lipase